MTVKYPQPVPEFAPGGLGIEWTNRNTGKITVEVLDAVNERAGSTALRCVGFSSEAGKIALGISNSLGNGLGPERVELTPVATIDNVEIHEDIEQVELAEQVERVAIAA